MLFKVSALLSALLLFGGCGGGGEELPERSGEEVDVQSDSSAEVRPASYQIQLTSPKPGTLLNGSTFQLKGLGKSHDSTLHYRLVFDSILTLTSGEIAMISDDSTATTTSFSEKVTFQSDWEGEVVLEVYENDTASGEEIWKVSIPLLLPPVPPSDTGRTVYSYFPNRRIGSLSDCSLVFPLTRELPGNSKGLARGAIYFVLKGVTEEEEKGGYFNRMPEGLRLDRIDLKDRVAHLDFSSHLNRSRRTCQSETIRAQIEQTIAQFKTVDAVVIRADGRIWKGGGR